MHPQGLLLLVLLIAVMNVLANGQQARSSETVVQDKIQRHLRAKDSNTTTTMKEQEEEEDNSDPSARIVGGSNVDDPYDFSVIGSGFLALCGGSLIHEYAILTAAHCADAFVSPLSATIGATTLSGDDGERRTIGRFIPHPRTGRTFGIFDVGSRNDIAVVCLRTPSSKTPVTLNFEARPGVGEDLLAMGHGQTVAGGVDAGPISETLQEIPLTVDPYCRRTSGLFFQWIPQTKFCAGSQDPGNVCFGDSGSAALDQEGRQVGIISSGLRSVCAQDGESAVFVSVASYQTFIQESIETCIQLAAR